MNGTKARKGLEVLVSLALILLLVCDIPWITSALPVPHVSLCRQVKKRDTKHKYLHFNAVGKKGHRTFGLFDIRTGTSEHENEAHNDSTYYNKRLSSRGGGNGGDGQKREKAINTPSSWWPPFPFNMLTRGGSHGSTEVQARSSDGTSASFPNNIILIGRYAVAKTRVGVRQFSRVASSASMHLPPAAAPLVLLSILPVGRKAKSASSTLVATAALEVNQLHLLSKRLALVSLGISVCSWAHCELQKYQRLTPLPLTVDYISSDEYSTVLPPFLPEHSTPPESNVLVSSLQEIENKDFSATNTTSHIRSSWQMAQLDQLTTKVKETPKTCSIQIQEWKMRRERRSYERQEMKRVKIMEELLSFQQLKKQMVPKNRHKWYKYYKDNEEELSTADTSIPPLGWALVSNYRCLRVSASVMCVG
jgi:hypothetical protein